MANIEDQVFPERTHDSPKQIKTLHATEGESKKLESNVRCQLEKLKTSNITRDNSNSLCHLFNTKQLSPQQVHDLMNFRDIGQTEY